MAGRQLRMKNGTITPTQDGGHLYYAPVILLDCRDCSGWTRPIQHSSTRVECDSCGGMQSNERLVDLNDERL